MYGLNATLDESGYIWMFGGSGASYAQNGLWRLNTNTGMWALMKGNANNAAETISVKGNSGVEGSSYTPSSRYWSLIWYDKHGYIWIFGGYGYNTNAASGYLNDLWRYNIATNQWAWISGSPANASPSGAGMGTKNQININNVIGARAAGLAVYDNTYVYQFGGYGVDSAAAYGSLNTFSRTKLYTN